MEIISKKKSKTKYDPPNRPPMSKIPTDKYRENYDKIFPKFGDVTLDKVKEKVSIKIGEVGTIDNG